MNLRASYSDGVARTESPAEKKRHPWGDLLGWLLMFAAIVLLVALATYDRRDLVSNTVPANPTPHNFMGAFGASLASSLFFLVGAAAYTLPVLGFFFGLAGFVSGLSYLRGWRSACGVAGLLIAATGLLDLYSASLPPLGVRHESMSAGGVMGWSLNTYFFRNFFNNTGASLFFGIIYLVSLIFLTDFRLISWVAALFTHVPRNEEERLAAEESALRKQEKELARRQRELERERPEKPEKEKARPRELERRNLDDDDSSVATPEPAARAGRQAKAKPTTEPAAPVSSNPDNLGADLQPIPEPTVRDLSIPRPRPPAEPMRTGDVIRADEILGAPSNAGLPTSEEDPEAPPAPSTVRKGKRSITDVILGREPSAPTARTGASNPFSTPDRDAAPEDEILDDLPSDTGRRNGAVEPVAPMARAIEPDDDDDSPIGLPAADAISLQAAAPASPIPSAPLAGSDAPAGGDGAPRPRGMMQTRKPRPITVASTPMIGNYLLPSIDLLNHPDLTVKPTETKEELMANARLMVQTLAQFGIEVAPGDITKGPTITRYELHPAPGVKLEKIAGLTNNIAAALKAERLNVLAPVPGKSSVGVEVPNLVKTKVIMRDLLESDEWRNSKARIPLALGKDVYGLPIIADLAEMPHVLIAGSTGSGKSVCINTIIASLLFKFTPDQLRFVMIDPKVVELQTYNALPHLVVPVVTDPKKVILALRWVVNEMEKRYQIFARVGVRNIKAFNERPKDKLPPSRQPELPLMQKKDKVEAGADGFAVEVDEQIVVPRDEDIVIPEKLSYIVVIIDELADLMLVAPADVEMAIARITQMARAAGIHCIVATQRPSVDVITGVIKANIPARIAFQVAAKVDSRTILDQMGADKLLGKGDMLYLPPGSGKLIRAQGALITDQEIEGVVDHIAKQGKPSYEMEIHNALQKAPSSVGSMSLDPDDEPDSADEAIIQRCIEVIRTERKASVSLLQRRLKLGYGRAARLMDELEDRGIVGPSKGAEPRDVLLDLEGEGYDGNGQSLV
jgi:S-DNA-T family DNA segregation ATPase FtsK/SpoIIIE